MKEPLGAGNRNVMLPDQSTDGAKVTKKAEERVEREIKKVSDLLPK